jgi:hypothetical protein
MVDILYRFATEVCAGDLPGAPAACGAGPPKSLASSSELATVFSILFGIIGALAFLMIVVSGLRYVLSAGSPEKISKAKNGIIYSLVGLIIALGAEAIVSFVVKSL